MAARKTHMGRWSKDEIKLLKKLYRNTETAKVAKKIGRPLQAVKKKASRLGLRKTKSYMRALGQKV